MPVTVVEGFRPNSKVYMTPDGLFYHLNKVKKDRLYLRCIHYYDGCDGRAVCAEDLGSFYTVTSAHNGHKSGKHLLEARLLRHKILKKCASRHPARFSCIVEEESCGSSRRVRSLNTAVRLRSAMRRARLQQLPKIPDDLSELDLVLRSQEYRSLTRTLDGKDYMYAGRCGSRQSGTRSLIFISSNMKKALKVSKVIFADGTEDGRPAKPPSKQIFSITSLWDGQLVPLCIALMERKNQHAYRSLFRALLKISPEFNPETIHCDFEAAQYNAWMEVFPEAKVEGCLYHYSKDVTEYARGLGYKQLIITNDAFASIVRSSLAIPMSPDSPEECLGTLMRRASAYGLYDILRPFFKYLHKEWVVNRRSVLLSVCDADDRTTNSVEAWNAKLQTYMREKRVNVFNFLDGLMRLEEDAKQIMYNIKHGISSNRPRKLSAVRNDAAIRKLTRLRKADVISTGRFLRSASYRISSHFRKVFPRNEGGASDSD